MTVEPAVDVNGLNVHENQINRMAEAVTHGKAKSVPDSDSADSPMQCTSW